MFGGALPTGTPMSDLNLVRGPFLTRAEAAARSRRGLDGVVALGGHYALEEVYPAFQFTPDGYPLPGLDAVREALGDGFDPWATAAWLSEPHLGLGGRAPADWLREGRPVDPVVDLARQARPA